MVEEASSLCLGFWLSSAFGYAITPQGPQGNEVGRGQGNNCCKCGRPVSDGCRSKEGAEPASVEYTIRRRLACLGDLRSGVAVQKPALKPEHREARLDFALRYTECDPAQSHVLFTDEAASPRRKCKVVPEDVDIPQYVKSVVSSGRHSVSVWDALSRLGLGPLVRLDSRFNGAAYVRVIEDHMLSYVLDGRFPGGCFILEQDRSSVHMSSTVQRRLDDLGTMQLEWPACSPDLTCLKIYGAL
ncbi:uncharacterized protein LOC135389604 [Ornithodoros turicata]|uniref:uncharacterized protein LOC135389604 n=1 Tax=Ornithodoros turicata TaxID=34597 RepID=UPI003138CA19